jgi:hypothetical protein
LPLKGSSETVSVWSYAWDRNILWGIAFFLPLTIANLLLYLRGKWESRGEVIAVILNMIGAAVYAYGVLHYFGDVGKENQPWPEDLTSLVQPLFYFIFCPLALLGVVRSFFSFRKR